MLPQIVYFFIYPVRRRSRPCEDVSASVPSKQICKILLGGICVGAMLVNFAAPADAQHTRAHAYARPHAAPHCHHGYSYPCLPPLSYDDYAPPINEEQAGQEPTDPDGRSRQQADASPLPPSESPFMPSAPSLSGATGTPSAPGSAAPNMIGDFFGNARNSSVIQTPSSFGTPTNITISGISPAQTIISETTSYDGITTENVSVPGGSVNGGVVTFQIPATTLNGVPLPATSFSSVGPTGLESDVFPNGSFALSPGDAAYQAALADAVVAQHGEGRVESTGGTAERVSTGTEVGIGPGGESLVLVESTYEVSQTVTFTPLVNSPAVLICIPNPGDTVVGRVKLSDNNSALPQDRIFFDYNYFHNVPLHVSGVDVNRFTPGFEKTFTDPFTNVLSSIQVRVPMATTLDSNVVADGPTNFDKFEMGNLNIALKTLLYEDAALTAAAGLGISLPTGDDLSVVTTNGTHLVEVKNEAVHLTPFLAALVTPNDWFFAHAFLSFDFDLNGNAVSLDQATIDFTNATITHKLTPAGQWNDQTFMFVDLSAGAWLFRDDSITDSLSGLALTAELHYAKSVSDADSVQRDNFIIGDPSADLDLLNATVGSHIRLGLFTTWTLGYSVPLTSADRVFDGEFRTFINRNF